MRRVIFLIMAAAIFIECTPSALKWELLAPIRNSETLVAYDLFANADSAMQASMPPNADKIVIIGGDSVLAAITLYEFEDIFWLDSYVFNESSQPFVINPSEFALLDGARVMFRQLEPHIAANIYASRMTNIPPYEPKYIYDVNSSTRGYVNIYDDQAYYYGNTETTITPREDPYNKLGYSIGAAIAANQNKQYIEMANAIYSVGFVEGTVIPSTVAARGGIFWSKGKTWLEPLTLRLIISGYEVQFINSDE